MKGRANTIEDVARRIRYSDDCWEWTGNLNGNGYGQVRYGGRMRPTHRLAWELAHGPIPPGLWVLHTCDNRVCMRPEHLWLGTGADNMADMVRKGRNRSHKGRRALFCQRGHPMEGDNLIEKPPYRGVAQRWCRTCRRESWKLRNRRRRHVV